MGKIKNQQMYKKVSKVGEENDYWNELESLRNKLNAAIKKSIEKEGYFINDEVLELQKIFDEKQLKYYQDK